MVTIQNLFRLTFKGILAPDSDIIIFQGNWLVTLSTQFANCFVNHSYKLEFIYSIVSKGNPNHQVGPTNTAGTISKKILI